MTRRAIKTSTYIMAPLMMGLLFCAEPIVKLLLTDKWLPCVPYLRIFCFTYLFWPIHTANLNAVKAMGRSDLFLRLEIIKKAIGLILLLLTIERIRGHPSELEWHQCRKHPQPLPEHLSAGRSGRTERNDGNAVWKEVGYGIVI